MVGEYGENKMSISDSEVSSLIDSLDDHETFLHLLKVIANADNLRWKRTEFSFPNGDSVEVDVELSIDDVPVNVVFRNEHEYQMIEDALTERFLRLGTIADQQNK